MSDPPSSFHSNDQPLLYHTQTTTKTGLSIKVGVWNVCGCPSQELRGNVVKSLGLDMVCICETFLMNDSTIEVDGYKWFGNNRKLIAKRAVRGSGGIGMLIKDTLIHNYQVAEIEEKYEGILWLQLKHKSNNTLIGICVCYLPPATLSRGDYSQEFIDTLKSLIIENYHLSDFMVCGDFNARCGNLQEECNEDRFPPCIVLDTTCNKNGRAFIDFLNSLDLCMLNGRFDPQYDGFTSVSAKGLAVVDYCVVPKVSFHKYCDFKVLDPLAVATNSSIKIDSKVPDHRILTWCLKVTDSVSPIQHPPPKKTIVQKKVPPNFLENDLAESQFHTLAE